MPNEIYHRSNWGESKAEDFGDVYYDHAATNKLYNHSDYYENSDGTDATLKDLNNKASIVLTPTAYSDGSLNTVIPPYQVLPTELVTNGDFATDSDWTKGTGWTISGGKAIATSAPSGSQLYQTSLIVGKTYQATFTITDITSGAFRFLFGDGSNTSGDYTSAGTYTVSLTAANSNRLGIRTVGTTSGSVDNISVKEIQEADFDFSRGSSATRVNEQGLVEDVQILSGELVQNGDFEQIGSELVTNGDFSENGAVNTTSYTRGWYSADSNISITSNELVITNGASVGGRAYATDGVNSLSVVTSGKIYKLVYTVTENNDNAIILYHTGGAYVTAPNAVGTHTIYYKAGGTIFILRNNTANTTVKIDNVSVKEVGQNWSGINGATLSFDSNRAEVTIAAQSGSGLASDSTVPVQSGKKYKLEADVEIGTYTGTSVILNLLGTSSSAITIDSSGVTRVSHIFDASSTTNTSARVLRGSADTGTLFIDNVSVIEITDDTDLPRIDFTDGTGSLLLEPQRTNTFVYSEDYSQTNWSKSQITVTPDSIVSPDGSVNASLITIAGNVPNLGQPQTLTLSTTYTMSAFVKKGTNRWVRLAYFSSADNAAWFDLENNVVGSQSTNSISASIENYGNGWYRIINTFTSNASSGNAFLGLSDADNSVYATGVIGNTVYAWGLQVTQGDYPTSYIPTSGSTVTRSADVANNSGNADLFNDSEGVLYAEIAALADSQTSRVISISDGTNDERVQIAYQNVSNRIKAFIIGGGTSTSLIANLTDITDFVKVALKYKSGDYALWVGGIEVQTKTSAFTPTGLVELAFEDGNGSNDFYGDVKCVAVFKEGLSNDLLERLTGEGYESFRLLAEANNYTII